MWSQRQHALPMGPVLLSVGLLWHHVQPLWGWLSQLLGILHWQQQPPHHHQQPPHHHQQPPTPTPDYLYIFWHCCIRWSMWLKCEQALPIW